MPGLTRLRNLWPEIARSSQVTTNTSLLRIKPAAYNLPSRTDGRRDCSWSEFGLLNLEPVVRVRPKRADNPGPLMVPNRRPAENAVDYTPSS